MSSLYKFLNPSYKHIAAAGNAGVLWDIWRYEPAEWQAFDEKEWNRARQEAWATVRTSLLLAIPVAVIFCLFGYSSGVWWFGLIIPLVVVIVGIWSGANLWWEARSRHQARQTGNRTVGFRADGVYEAGRFIPMVTYRQDLIRVYVDRSDPYLLHFQVVEMSGRSSNRRDFRFPIPSDPAQAVGDLLARYQQEVIRGK